MRVLVTGGAGFVGSHVVDRLIGADHGVVVVDNLSTGRRELVNGAADLEVVDIRSPRLDAVVAAARPEAVVHLAAQAAVPRSVADPLFDAGVNVLGTINLLESAARSGVRRVIYISTGGAGYGDTDVIPTPEDHPLRPASPYGVSKIGAERYLEAWAPLAGAGFVTLRLANVYGPRQNPEGEAGVVAIFAHRLLRGERCTVNGDGEQTRDYVYVGDVAEAVARALAAPEVAGVFNVGTGLETTVNALYAAIAAVVGTRETAVHGPAKPGEQRRSALDVAHAKAVLGWTPDTPLRDGIVKTVTALKKEVGA